ncbi:DNA-directed RNA polymerase subunit delta [Amphibacillus marinus]|uniref:Probable DNA-directed RNA polymerase subunit delta n=1 Tax=Amphibacillus marinus TaxID=872970 RepID=A0A1H8MZS4_9BACI|nr:DNA-directed RNA polymerase subunit delta [Amphibacillus marinus]SEO22790.1 DNA-directed RNA polymerase subunit delta [Amphibacillus marinus]
MSIANLSRDELREQSMIELATMVLEREKKAMNYLDIFNKVAEIKGFSEEEKEAFIAQFYTDLNLDGRFLTLGAGQWGMKVWYPVEQIDEEITAEPKKKKKKKKKVTKAAVEKAIEEEDLTEVPLDFAEEDYDDEDIDLGDDDIADDEFDDEGFDEEDDLSDDDYEDDEDDYEEDDEESK